MSGVVATFGFTFYIQPMLMPMIAEMPRGNVGIKILAWSARFVTLGKLPRLSDQFSWLASSSEPRHLAIYSYVENGERLSRLMNSK